MFFNACKICFLLTVNGTVTSTVNILHFFMSHTHVIYMFKHIGLK